METCRVCGCSDMNACWDEVMGQPCSWAEPNLCSVCASRLEILGRVLLPGEFALISSGSTFTAFVRGTLGDFKTMKADSMEDIIQWLAQEKVAAHL